MGLGSNKKSYYSPFIALPQGNLFFLLVVVCNGKDLVWKIWTFHKKSIDGLNNMKQSV